MSYHNTTQSNGAELKQYQARADSQEDQILAFFDAGGSWAPSEIQHWVLPRAPITSIRRAITNLTARKELVKTTGQKPGPYARPEFTWRRVSYQPALF